MHIQQTYNKQEFLKMKYHKGVREVPKSVTLYLNGPEEFLFVTYIS